MARVYVGNLPTDIKERELDDLFYKYGNIRDIDVKCPSRPPAFAFVTFSDSRDAEDAIRGRDGYNFDGYRLRCEFAKGSRPTGAREGPRGGRRTDFGVTVSNLPRNCSWQDLKDFMRGVGDVVFTDVSRDGEGVVEFSNKDDMERAVKKLDDTEFKNHGDSSYIRVKFARKARSEDRGRDRSRSREHSRSRSRDRGASRASRSPSPAADRGDDDR